MCGPQEPLVINAADARQVSSCSLKWVDMPPVRTGEGAQEPQDPAQTSMDPADRGVAVDGG